MWEASILPCLFAVSCLVHPSFGQDNLLMVTYAVRQGIAFQSSAHEHILSPILDSTIFFLGSFLGRQAGEVPAGVELVPLAV